MVKIFNKLFIILLGAVFLLPNVTVAAQANLQAIRSASEVNVGSNFTISARLSADESLNAAKVTLAFSGAEFVAVSTGELTAIDGPRLNGSAIIFEGYKIGGFTNALLFQATFRGDAAGTANFSFSTYVVKANDGLGSEVPVTVSDTSVSIAAQSVPPPENPSGSTTTQTPVSQTPSTQATTPPASTGITVSSASHPDQNAWYKINNPKFSWNKGSSVKSVSYEFNQSSDTVPLAKAMTDNGSITYNNVADGVWYFHIRALAQSWGKAQHYRVQIDTNGPLVNELKLEGSDTLTPSVVFNVTDAVSGVESIYISYDDGEYKSAASPYKLEPNDVAGKSQIKISVKAVDKAANETITTEMFDLAGSVLPAPKIATIIASQVWDTSAGRIKSLLHIYGTAYPLSKVSVHVFSEEVVKEVEADEKGRWQVTVEDLEPGEHKVWAVTKYGDLESAKSEEIGFTKDEGGTIVLAGHEVVADGQKSNLPVVLGSFFGVVGLAVLFPFAKKVRKNRELRRSLEDGLLKR
ncbi:MAG: hypothetical protein BWY68_00633 [bacterium ADurb.Bin400]|nr:MAG: hypothetical protein BWY68_00633 [bacterium ADurb.Bin400]